MLDICINLRVFMRIDQGDSFVSLPCISRSIRLVSRWWWTPITPEQPDEPPWWRHSAPSRLLITLSPGSTHPLLSLVKAEQPRLPIGCSARHLPRTKQVMCVDACACVCAAVRHILKPCNPVRQHNTSNKPKLPSSQIPNNTSVFPFLNRNRRMCYTVGQLRASFHQYHPPRLSCE